MITNLQLDPGKFYGLCKIMRSIDEDAKYDVEDISGQINTTFQDISTKRLHLAQANNNMLQEIRLSTKVNPFSSFESQEHDADQFRHTLTGANFLRVSFNIVDIIYATQHTILTICKDIIPGAILIASDNFDGKNLNFEKIQQITYESQLNKANIETFVDGCISLDIAQAKIVDIANNIALILDEYYRSLLKRHSEDGVKIFRDPIATDIAISVLENIDSHGEIESGKKPDEISAYSMRKAEVLLNSIRIQSVHRFIERPEAFIDYIYKALNDTWVNVASLKAAYKRTVDGVIKIVGRDKATKSVSDSDFFTALQAIKDVNPHSIVGKDSTKMLTSEERFNINFKNETLEKLVELLTKGTNTPEIIKYVLERKSSLRKYFQEENSFYVCRIGGGNAFLGDAPGALSVIPGSKPNVKLDDIVGSGFAEVKSFVSQIEAAGQWHDLFVATSPSKTADKSNVLLIGPPGCLANDTFIQFEVRDKSTHFRINHKGGKIERLYQRFNKLPQTIAGPRQQNDDVYYLASSINDEGEIIQNLVNNVVCTGEKECFELITAGGESIVATEDHKFFIGNKYTELKNLKSGDYVFVHRNFQLPTLKETKAPQNKYRQYLFVKHHPIAGKKIISDKDTDKKYEYYRLARPRAVMEASINKLEFDIYVDRLNSGNLEGLKFLPRELHVHHRDEDFTNDSIDNLVVIDGVEHNREHSSKEEAHKPIRYSVVEDKIVSINSVGLRKTYDIQMNGPFNNVIANGIVVHNCGKTHALRSVASDTGSIGIFAQGSDFNTCWKGEAEKNPKRLFEGAIKLHKESNKHIHILIDEIDSILKKKEFIGHGETDLTLEFQTLMDGVVHYPSITVWGTTNFPERIPMAMLRRFSCLLVVGELSITDRINLLRHYANYMPVSNSFRDVDWQKFAERLDGATGDVIRKVVDHVWRSKMTTFVKNNSKEAASAMDYLVEQNEGKKFDISKFDDKMRQNFKNKLSPHVSIVPEDLKQSIEIHLKNVGIHNEIQSAKQTYAEAHQFLARLENKS